MESDLRLSSDQYEWLLTIFYIAYILFEPLIVLFKILPTRIWLAILVAGWGIAATTQAAAQSWSGMMACRFFLAAFEAGYGPGAVYLLSFFYLRKELGLRIGIFFSSAPLATCFAGALAYGITSGHSQLANWRLLFLVEGVPVLIMAIVSYFAMPSSAHDAWFLNEDEKRHAMARQLRQVGVEERVGTFNWRETVATFLDTKAWITALMYFSCNVSYSSLPVFLPTILQDMGESLAPGRVKTLMRTDESDRILWLGCTRSLRTALFYLISMHDRHNVRRRPNPTKGLGHHRHGASGRNGVRDACRCFNYRSSIYRRVSCCSGHFPDHCEHLALGCQQSRVR